MKNFEFVKTREEKKGICKNPRGIMDEKMG